MGVPELAHLAQDRDPAAAGQAGQELQGGEHRARARRCSCRRRSTTPPARITIDRCSARDGVASPGTISSRLRPAASPAAVAASALWTARRPRAGIATGRSPAGVTSRKRMPSSPRDSTPAARTSASVGEAVGHRSRARVRAAIGRTRASSALRIATPAVGGRRAAPRAARPWRPRSRPATRSATGGPAGSAVTMPISGRPIAARSRISPPTYMPISRTAAACSGPSRSTVSGRPTSLFWLPSVRERDQPLLQHAGDGLLRRGLGDAPGDPDDQRIEPEAPGGRHGLQRPQRLVDEDDRHVAQRVEGRLAGFRIRQPADQQRRGAGLGGRGEEAVTVGALARQRDEQHPGLHQPGVDGAAADRAIAVPDERAAGCGDEIRRGQRGERRPSSRGRVSHRARSRADVRTGRHGRVLRHEERAC